MLQAHHHMLHSCQPASAGLLHDTVEDTNDVSFEEIGNWFGSAVRRIVEGETRFSKIGKISGMTPGADVKAEDLRQLFLAMTEEVRIIVVKLADRLHNMRTLGSMKPEKQKKIAAETLQVGFTPTVYSVTVTWSLPVHCAHGSAFSQTDTTPLNHLHRHAAQAFSLQLPGISMPVEQQKLVATHVHLWDQKEAWVSDSLLAVVGEQI